MADWGFSRTTAERCCVIAHDPGVRLCDLAATLDLTDRSAFAIVRDLTDAGYVRKERDGRRNRCIINRTFRSPRQRSGSEGSAKSSSDERMDFITTR
jgi:hypothetical protein